MSEGEDAPQVVEAAPEVPVDGEDPVAAEETSNENEGEVVQEQESSEAQATTHGDEHEKQEAVVDAMSDALEATARVSDEQTSEIAERTSASTQATGDAAAEAADTTETAVSTSDAAADTSQAQAMSEEQGVDDLEATQPAQNHTQEEEQDEEDLEDHPELNRIDVEFNIDNGAQTHRETFDLSTTIDQVAQVLAARFRVSTDDILLRSNGIECESAKTIEDHMTGDEKDGVFVVETLFANQQAISAPYTMPEVIEVRLEPQPGQDLPEVVYVKIVRENEKKPKAYLGGFKDKRYDLIYHHAWTQTKRKKKKEKALKFHRETQTIDTSTRSQQTTRESGTQMDRKDLYVDHSNDRVIVARPYFSAAQLEAVRQIEARNIQCFLRQCFAYRRVRRLRGDNEARKAKARDDEDVKQSQANLQHQKQIQRRMHPRTTTDFDVLHKELEAWRLHETARIKNSNMSDADKQEELKKLLAKEVKLLQTIDRLRVTASKENKFNVTKSNLEKMASPKEWRSSEGDVVEVETPFTTRAKELVELYNGLCLQELPKEERIDVLLHVKYTVDEFDCELTRDIISLIQREEDMLRRGRPEKALLGLRTRLSNLFLQFIETPSFNPEAAAFQRVAYVEVDSSSRKMGHIQSLLRNKTV
jgi:hypothetical protein